jgi:hypothetical protein
MKHFIILLFFGLVIIPSQAQESTTSGVNLKSSAEKMGKLFVEKNYEQYVKFVHPKILKMFGGEEKMIEFLKKTIEETENQGFTFKDVKIGEHSELIVSGNELQSIVPQILELKTKDGRLVSTSYLLALSPDKGKKWYFIDTAGKTLEQLKSIFPTLSNKLIIPPATQPVFYND